MLWSHPLRPPYPISSIIGITDSIHSASRKYFAIIDLANIFCSMSISAASQVQFGFTSKRTPLPAYPWGISAALSLYTIHNCTHLSLGTQILHTLMTSSSKEIHLIHIRDIEIFTKELRKRIDHCSMHSARSHLLCYTLKII